MPEGIARAYRSESKAMAAKIPRGTSKQRDNLRVASPPPIEPGQVVAGKYRVEQLIKASPSTFVLAARHLQLRSPVIIKVFAAYTEEQGIALERRIERARAATELRGDHIAPIVEIGTTEDGMPYVATERFEGLTLEGELAARGRLPFTEAARWIVEACDGIAVAHSQGIVHGNLRPSNLLLAEPKKLPTNAGAISATHARKDTMDPRELKVLDFGVSSPVDTAGASDDSASVFFGSPAYLAPEQIREPERVSAHTDVWALGVVLHELVAGTLPFSADVPSAVLAAVIFDAAPLLTDAPYELARIVNRCLSKDPSDRPSDIGELAQALAPFAGAKGVELAEHARTVLSTARDETSGVRERPTTDRERSPIVKASMPTRGRSITTRPSLRLRKHCHRRIRQTTGAAFAAAVAFGIFATRYISPTVHVPESTPDLDLPEHELPPVRPIVPTMVLETKSHAANAGPTPVHAHPSTITRAPAAISKKTSPLLEGAMKSR